MSTIADKTIRATLNVMTTGIWHSIGPTTMVIPHDYIGRNNTLYHIRKYGDYLWAREVRLEIKKDGKK